jgi:UDP-N-acetylglucosamine 2-epimerase (non-hydrolysing)
MQRIAVIVGTRPQIIKTAPVVRKLARSNECKLLIVHTGQHYDFELSKIFLNEMKFPDPIVNLGVRADSHATQTAAMIVGLEREMVRLRPDIVLVPGDTNSALSAALTAVKLKIPYAHLEAGPRQFDLSNPEEANRVVVDHLSTIAFAPTLSSLRNLRREGFGRRRAIFTGDTMLDSLHEHIRSSARIDVGSNFGVEPGFVLTTIHRQENTEDPARLGSIIRAMASSRKLTFVFPTHPRTKKMLGRFRLMRKLINAKNVHLLPPVDYESSLALISKAKVVLTDSGGLQKEAFWLGVPCVTVLKTTPWPETLREGANRCVEPNSRLVKALSEACSVRFDSSRYTSLFGGEASGKVCRILISFAGESGQATCWK